MKLIAAVRAGVCGACVAAMGLSLAGCSTFRREWPTNRLTRTEHKKSEHGPVVFAPDVAQKDPNAVAMDGLPSGVQASFRAEHPAAGITSIKQKPTGTGLIVYEVAYWQDGVPGIATYTAGGSDLKSPPQGVVIRPDDSGRPKAKFAPATRPAQAEVQILALE